MKLAAILLLLLLSFNFAGYRLVFFFLQKSADQTMAARLDAEQYNEADLLTITVPLKLPYQVAQKDFERVDGEIKVEGKIYKYVKRKVEGGQLVLLCLPDQQKMQLESARHTAFKITGAVPLSGKSDATKSLVIKNILSDYDRNAAPWRLPPLVILIQHGQSQNPQLLPFFLPTADRPPEAAVA